MGTTSCAKSSGLSCATTDRGPQNRTGRNHERHETTRKAGQRKGNDRTKQLRMVTSTPHLSFAAFVSFAYFVLVPPPEHRVLRVAPAEQISHEVEHLLLIERVEQVLGHQAGGGRGLLLDLRLGDLPRLTGVFGIHEDGE